VGPRAGLDGQKISSPPEFDPGPSSPDRSSVAIPTELPDPHNISVDYVNVLKGILPTPVLVTSHGMLVEMSDSQRTNWR